MFGHQHAVRNQCLVLLLSLGLLGVLGFIGLQFGPDLLALVWAGKTDHLPHRLGLRDLGEAAAYDRKLELGGTSFAGQWYHPGAVLSDEQLAMFRQDGYIVLRGLLPRTIILSLREELLRGYSFEFEKNGHYEEKNAALLDFLTFGPFGEIAAQLFENDRVHLLRSVHHFRPTTIPFQRISHWHYDWLECDEDLPTRGSSRWLVKFNIALFDDMPSMWLVNETAFEAMAIQKVGRDVARELSAGPRGPPLSEEELDQRSIQPTLSLGDAIVHSAAVPHKSPPAARGRRIGFVSPSYASPEARCTGRRNSNRECQWEEHVGVRSASTFSSRIADLPAEAKRACYPQVHPRAALEGLKGPLKLSLRQNFRTGPLRRFLSNALTRWLLCMPGHEKPQTDAGWQGLGEGRMPESPEL